MCFLAARNLSPSTEHRRALVGSCERVARYKYSITVVVHSVSIIAHDSSVLHKTRDLDHVEDDFLFPCSSISKPWLVRSYLVVATKWKAVVGSPQAGKRI